MTIQNPLNLLQQLWQQEPPVDEEDTVELCNVGDTVEIVWGDRTLIGRVMEFNPTPDSWGDVYFRVEGVVNGRFDTFKTSCWISDAAVLTITR